VHEKAHAENGENDEPEGKLEDHPLVAKQPFLRNPPAIEEQQRR
jgi:hypothetical protein